MGREKGATTKGNEKEREAGVGEMPLISQDKALGTGENTPFGIGYLQHTQRLLAAESTPGSSALEASFRLIGLPCIVPPPHSRRLTWLGRRSFVF